MQKLDGKIVRFISTDRKYMRDPYPSMAPWSNSLNTFLTGQHFNSSDEDLKHGLSPKEMTGDAEITPAGRKKLFPHIIDPMRPVHIVHMQKYDCTVNDKKEPNNPKDYAEAHYFLFQPIVAMDKDKMMKRKHYFYLEDKEAEAKNRMQKSDLVYEAEKCIREKANIGEYTDMVRLLNLKVPGFYVEPENLTDIRLKDVLLEQAKLTPGEVIFCFSSAASGYMFIAKLLAHKIVQKRNDGYYDGPLFLAEDALKLNAFIDKHDNEVIVGKWGSLLRDQETNPIETEK